MPRVPSLNMLLETTGTDYLAELTGRVLDNLSAQAVSMAIKNPLFSGDPESGSVEFKRLANSEAKAYGTARSAGKGDGVVARPVPVLINQDKEIIEEIEAKDIRLYGVDGLLNIRSVDHVSTMVRTLDKAFFAAAVTEGTEFTPTESTAEDQVEEAIQELESTQNDFTDGIMRDHIVVVCNPKVYGDIRKYLQTSTRQNRQTGLEDEFDDFNGCRTFKSIHLPSGVKFVILTDTAVGQPVMSDGYQAERVPQSNSMSVDLFFSFGTGVVEPDHVLYVSGE